MIKLFVTGDNHIGRQYAGSPVKDVLVQSRVETLRQMVHTAENERCDYFVITGDLFDRVNNVSKRDIDQIVGILEEFNQTVLVLPGNHDFFTGSEKLWKDFIDRITSGSNIVLLNRYQPYIFDCGEDELIVYPAYCDSKHSNTNRLNWISNGIKESDSFIIGIAHGTIRGVSPDMNEDYFPMDITELNAIPVDAWLIGHTHITYPFDMPYGKDMTGFSVFNAGTHTQLDSSNNTEGNALIISLDRHAGIKTVLARKIHTGDITFKKIAYVIAPGESVQLSRLLETITETLPDRTVFELAISGTISEEDYLNREELYESILGRFLWYSVNDDELVPAISLEKIQNEYSEFSLAAQFLTSLLDEPIEVQMAYELLKKCNESGK